MNYLNIKTGMKIRSYDFAGRKDCYMEGVVIEAIGNEDFAEIHFMATKCVCEGNEMNIADFQDEPRITQRELEPFIPMLQPELDIL